MIRSFATKETAAFFANQRVRRFDGEWLPVARCKLAQLNRVLSIEELRVPPGNRRKRLGGLSGRAMEFADQHSVANLH